tara:strand:+ start:447 stop:680 length:234 start_codon:yes stop_codon:yes gene_type:complete
MREKIKADIQPMTIKEAIEIADAIGYNGLIYDQILFMDNEVELGMKHDDSVDYTFSLEEFEKKDYDIYTYAKIEIKN